jgi:hypothetical protein
MGPAEGGPWQGVLFNATHAWKIERTLW